VLLCTATFFLCRVASLNDIITAARPTGSASSVIPHYQGESCVTVKECCVLQAWEEGGYSDDMTATAKCSQHQLRVISPSSAVFVQRIEKGTSFAEHWDYLRRCAWLSD
jgi:hypothetical protein